MIDIGIIGAGPAGLSAAINSIARNKTIILFNKNINSSALFKAKKINNHIGTIGLSGKEILQNFFDDIKKLNIKIKNNRVSEILSMGNSFKINYENNFVDVKSIIIAIGLQKDKKIAGEEKFLGRGVSYCATCDGMFYKNKTVCVICNLDEDSIEDIKFLCEVCKKIYCIIEKKSDPKILLKESNIEIIHETPKEILGDDKANNLLLSNNKNIECDGIFILKEFTPIDRIIYGLGIDNGVIKVNRACETNLAGVFAAGDCTGWPMQLSKAIGEGQIAAQAAAKFIDSKK